jgi:hypothetical protein
MEGMLELHWERDPWGQLSLVLYQHLDNGQLALVDRHQSQPFGEASDTAVWLTRALTRANVTELS